MGGERGEPPGNVCQLRPNLARGTLQHVGLGVRLPVMLRQKEKLLQVVQEEARVATVVGPGAVVKKGALQVQHWILDDAQAVVGPANTDSSGVEALLLSAWGFTGHKTYQGHMMVSSAQNGEQPFKGSQCCRSSSAMNGAKTSSLTCRNGQCAMAFATSAAGKLHLRETGMLNLSATLSMASKASCQDDRNKAARLHVKTYYNQANSKRSSPCRPPNQQHRSL